MDPLSQAMQMLQEAQQILAMQAEEIQALRQQVQKPQAQQQGQPMQKQASIHKLTAITGLREEEVPSFLKIADENEVSDFMNLMESRARQTTIGKIAEIQDGNSFNSPGEELESALAGLLGN